MYFPFRNARLSAFTSVLHCSRRQRRCKKARLCFSESLPPQSVTSKNFTFGGFCSPVQNRLLPPTEHFLLKQHSTDCVSGYFVFLSCVPSASHFFKILASLSPFLLRILFLPPPLHLVLHVYVSCISPSFPLICSLPVTVLCLFISS